jgi:uncharacterized membrane protein
MRKVFVGASIATLLVVGPASIAHAQEEQQQEAGLAGPARRDRNRGNGGGAGSYRADR